MSDQILIYVRDHLDSSWKELSDIFHCNVHGYVQRRAPELLTEHNILVERAHAAKKELYQSILTDAADTGTSVQAMCKARGVSYRAVMAYRRRSDTADYEVGDGKHSCLKCGKKIDSSLWFCRRCKELNEELIRNHDLSGDLLYWTGGDL